eukprot:15437167-Alexandrium_andersonii.AAC.1
MSPLCRGPGLPSATRRIRVRRAPINAQSRPTCEQPLSTRAQSTCVVSPTTLIVPFEQLPCHSTRRCKPRPQATQ